MRVHEGHVELVLLDHIAHEEVTWRRSMCLVMTTFRFFCRLLCDRDSSPPGGGEVGHTSGFTVTSPPRGGAFTVRPPTPLASFISLGMSDYV